ncbi:DUF6507 family protein [Actinoallomurus iriomotensis]|uniref:Uncharacterized protein n=1 Tax=Actinoallomurus iriomotensis TaxID=478107 RepID=A0A9W6W5K3_9ACTN|nr:DUF6507 family protein [Actinoallomurus iriomotensis]GLY92150.1 hypothetical protein Airi02_100780 [Actinoallomurus iriomotensis]
MAPRWKVKPEGVKGVVTRTVAAAKPFEGQYKSFVDNLNAAGQNCQSGIVSKALTDFATHHQLTLPRIVKRTHNSLNGAVKATNAYIEGDHQMMLDAQRNAAKAPVVDLPKRKPAK